jgi:hypothetical protein
MRDRGDPLRGLSAAFEGGSARLETGLATERRLFLSAGGSRPARQGMRAFTDRIAKDGGSPWADAERLRPWQDGEAVDLGSDPAHPEGRGG